MASSLAVTADGTTITVIMTLSPGAGYALGSASITVKNSSGTTQTASSDTPTNPTTTRTVTFTGLPADTYTVTTSCGSETGRSNVSTGSASVSIVSGM